jgi:hypothetical protein
MKAVILFLLLLKSESDESRKVMSVCLTSKTTFFRKKGGKKGESEDNTFPPALWPWTQEDALFAHTLINLVLDTFLSCEFAAEGRCKIVKW